MIIQNLMSNDILSFAAYTQSIANPHTSQLKKAIELVFSREFLLRFWGGVYSSTKLCYVTEGHSEDKT